ncbi:MAG: sporulation protein [Chloroflexi bacterium]|nr:sporulation protein [Chloroflexota bacterium]
MFDFLKGAKATMTVTLDRAANQAYLPGETVRAQIVVETQGEFKVQEGRVALVYIEDYQYRDERATTDSDGDHSREIVKVWGKSEAEVQRVVFAREGPLPKNVRQTFDYSVAIPPQALPSLTGGAILKSRWVVKATLDRRLASDVNTEAMLTVVTLALGTNRAPGEFGASNEPNEAALSLALPGHEFVPGETISGQFSVRPAKNFDASEVRVELVCLENVPREKGNTHEGIAKVKLAGGTKFQAGQPIVFPFSVAVPAVAPASANTPNGSITWVLKGVLSRTLRSDTRVEEPVLVYPARR